MHHWRSSPSRTWPERKWQRFVHNHNIHPLEQTQYGGIMLTEFKIHFTFTLNSGSRSSLTISQTQFSSISSSSFSLLRTARARTSSALAGSVCLRWDSSAVVWNKLSSKKKKINLFLFLLFQGLFRNFSDVFLPLLRTHMERLVADSHESKQRCVAEIISGLIRGSKHWSYSKVCVYLKLWFNDEARYCTFFWSVSGQGLSWKETWNYTSYWSCFLYLTMWTNQCLHLLCL